MITIIDRYISRTYISYFLAGLTVFVTLFLIVDFMVTTSRYDVGMGVFAQFYACYAVEILYQLIPVACLMATIFTLGTLNKSNELVALFSMGWSLMRVSLPIILIVGAISGGSFFLSNELMTTVMDKKNQIYYTEMKKKPWLYNTSKQEKIWYRSGQNIFNINLLNSKEQKAFDVTVYTFSQQWEMQQVLVAKEADIQDGQWTLKYGRVTIFYDQDAAPISENFEERVLVLGEDIIDIKASDQASATMGVRELNKYIQRNRDAGLNTTSFEVDYHAKFSYIATALVMVLLGIPFSVSGSRSGGVLVNLQICLLLTLIYWAFYNSGLTLGRHGSLPPVIAAWGPNLLMASVAGFFIRRLKK